MNNNTPRISSQALFNELGRVADIMPSLVYWLDRNGIVLGVNKRTCLALGGLDVHSKIVGKRHEDFYPRSIARQLTENNRKVIASGTAMEFEEEVVNVITGKTQYYAAVRSPWFDDDGNIIGIIGTSIDITDKKEKERLLIENIKLKHENETQLVISNEQDKFRKVVEQMAHDIRSPLSSLMIVAKISDNIPEKERVALREVANRISNITNNLLSNFKETEVESTVEVEEREAVLVSPEILQILTEKYYQYSDFSIVFTPQFTQAGHFCWIKIQPAAFKRMLSNVINNAVDAYDLKPGTVTVHLDADDEQVHITIEDYGKGMSADVREKILNEIDVSAGKEDGHGIGLGQVRDTLHSNEGRWFIESAVGQGTKFTVVFPRTSKDDWLADSIQLYEGDTVVVLDDDNSIHLAWDLRFQRIRQDHPLIKARHFEQGQEAIDFINGLSAENKQKIFLFADYELLQQNMNGLDVIARTKTTRCALVTSHYANKDVRKAAAQSKTRILPKQLASEVPIHIGKAATQIADSTLKTVDVIFIDDEVCLLESYKMFASGKIVDTYSVPEEFLDAVAQYPKNTRILLDQNFANSALKGIQIAEQLHAMGYTRLFLLSGGALSQLKIPDYLTFLQKGDLDSLEIVLNNMS